MTELKDKTITTELLEKIASLLEVKAGIKILVMPSEFLKKGTAYLLMNPDDINSFESIFTSIQAIENT